MSVETAYSYSLGIISLFSYNLILMFIAVGQYSTHFYSILSRYTYTSACCVCYSRELPHYPTHQFHWQAHTSAKTELNKIKSNISNLTTQMNTH